MSAPRISLLLCTYNGAQYLDQQLESIYQQHRPPDELVVSDDGSFDETVQIIKRHARRAPFPVHLMVNSANMGMNLNYAQALTRCTGDIIVPLAQDDIQHPAKLYHIANLFEQRPDIGLCFSDSELIDEHSQPIGLTLWQTLPFSRKEQRIVEAGDILAVLLRKNVVSGPAMAFRAEYSDLIVPIAPGWFEDGWTAVVIAAVSKVAIIREPLVKYRLHPKQMCGFIQHPIVYNRSWALTVQSSWMVARDELRQRLHAGRGDKALARIDDMIDHCSIRSELPPGRIHRVPWVMRELLNHRYARYSHGWKSAMSDLTYPSPAGRLLRRSLIRLRNCRPRRLAG